MCDPDRDGRTLERTCAAVATVKGTCSKGVAHVLSLHLSAMSPQQQIDSVNKVFPPFLVADIAGLS
jgi:hypothetical protein